MTPALEGIEWSAARPGGLYPKETPGTHCTGGKECGECMFWYCVTDVTRFSYLFQVLRIVVVLNIIECSAGI